MTSIGTSWSLMIETKLCLSSRGVQLRWARGEGLLRGQGNRRRESLLKKFRNNVAHGSGDHLVTPVDAARDISDAAEIINQLWGSATSGGHLYPAPMRRQVQVVAWSPGKVLTGLVGAGLPADEYPGWTCVLLRAVVHDGSLDRFDAQYETTAYPCDLLWGPGSWQEASLWLEDQPHDEDEVEVLDRLFLFQHDQDRLYLPRNPDVAAGLGEEDRQGAWYLIRADFPDDAIGHARGIVLGQCKSAAGPCDQCAAESIGVGSWAEIIDLAVGAAGPVTPRRSPDFKVPTLRSVPRFRDTNQLGNGQAGAIRCQSATALKRRGRRFKSCPRYH